MEKDHCVIVIAHMLSDALAFQLDYLSKDFDVFLHLDKKCNDNLEVFLENLSPNIIPLKRQKVYWGGFSLIDVTINALRLAKSSKEYNYYHLISGDTFPTKKNSFIKDYLKNSKASFIDYNPLPIKIWGFNGGLDRVNRYWFTSVQNRNLVKYSGRLFLFIQKILGVKRKSLSMPLYGGAQWFSLHTDAVKYIIHYLSENPDFLSRFYYTRACDEIFFHTILGNNKNLEIINDCKRYIDWQSGPEYPKNLTSKDVEKIIESDTFFCRKVNDISLMKKLVSIYEKEK